jgi:arylsulfatase A-like enzyme
MDRFSAMALTLVLSGPLLAQSPLPNILWLSSEDHGPHIGCYGDSLARTPHIDALASRGLKYRCCWSNAPVCAPARTTIITGMYPPSLGAEDMRSLLPLPEGVRAFPELLRAAGYYCTNRSKEDYNVRVGDRVWDASSRQAHWRNRRADQPFFAVFNSTVSHESAIRRHEADPTTDPQQVRVPRYLPDTPTVRRDWAIYYDSVAAADVEAGERLAELEAEGLTESTIIFYWADHGSGMPRSKRWPGNSGLQVPLVVYIPEAFAHLRPPEYAAGGTSERLVSFVDFAPTLLRLAGLTPPDWMQGEAFLGAEVGPGPDYLYGFRGRMDERPDLVRSVTDGRFVYLRNYRVDRPHGQRIAYQMETPTTAQWYAMFRAGGLTDVQGSFWDAPRAPEELYDLASDPDEVRNLAQEPQHQATLLRLREANRRHMLAIRDVGLLPEGLRVDVAGGGSPYDWASRQGTRFLEPLLEVAERASDASPISSSAWLDVLTSPDPPIRYWGVMGCIMRPARCAAPVIEQMRRLEHDAAPAVAIAASLAVALGEDPVAARGAARGLLGWADWQRHGVFAAMQALDAIEQLPEGLRPTAAELASLPTEGPVVDARYGGYVPRLLESLRNR